MTDMRTEYQDLHQRLLEIPLEIARHAANLPALRHDLAELKTSLEWMEADAVLAVEEMNAMTRRATVTYNLSNHDPFQLALIDVRETENAIEAAEQGIAALNRELDATIARAQLSVAYWSAQNRTVPSVPVATVTNGAAPRKRGRPARTATVALATA